VKKKVLFVCLAMALMVSPAVMLAAPVAAVVEVVDIDIKPGSDSNSINPFSKGVIAVAILSTDDFDALSVDAASVAFGPDGAAPAHKDAHIEDVDSDGDLDLVLHFRTQETGIAAGDIEATLTGQTFDGISFSAVDSVRTVPESK
jgi:hypothetical protein